MAVRLASDVLERYYRFSLYNSPFAAHDRGHAIDLYPAGERAPSPVAGEVRDVRAVEAPPKPYAEPEDYLLLVDTGEYIARILHVEPAVEPGEAMAVGDDLGRLVRAGFFAPWVPNHVHLEFRDPDRNPYRASGSVRIDPAVDVVPVDWDGTGRVRERGDTWVRLDAPTHPAPGDRFAGIESDGGVLDGGFPHYDGGGLVGGGDRALLAGESVGTVDGRHVTWADRPVLANGRPVTGVALYCDREDVGVKLVGEDLSFAVGEDVTVTVTVECAGDRA